MFIDDRTRALLEAMKLSGPGGPLMSGMGRVTGVPGLSAGAIRGGIGNRGSGRGALAFSPFAAQVAMGKSNLAEPTRPPAAQPQGPAPGFYGQTPPGLGGPGPQGLSAPQGTSGPDLYADGGGLSSGGFTPAQPTPGNPVNNMGDVLDANTLRKLLMASRGLF